MTVQLPLQLPRGSRGPARSRGRPFGVLALLLLLAVSGCGLIGRGTATDWSAAERGEDRFVLEVDNHNFNDARLYARWNGDRRRIGRVGGNQKEWFTLDWSTRQFRVEVDFLAGGGFVSESVNVSPGDTIFFRIPAGAR